MKADIVFPGNNESEFIKIAEKLGYDKLILVYDKAKDLSGLQGRTKIILECRVSKFRSKGDFAVVKSSDKDRNVIESKRASIIYDFELEDRPDFIHHRNSGLNQVLCKLMAKNCIKLGVSFSTILNHTRSNRAKIIGRMMQNIRFCRKYKVGIVFASFAKKPYEMRDAKELEVFGRLMGVR